MDVDFREVVQSLGSAVAVADAGDWHVHYENARFFQWFPPDGTDEETLVERVGGFKADRALARLRDGRPFAFETTTTRPGAGSDGASGRELPVRVEVRRLNPDDEQTVVVECWDVAKEKEVQYMLDSYSTLAERNAREVQKEKDRVERLLLNIMPRAVLEEMKDYGTATPQRFDDATILYLDFVGFTSMAISQDPAAVISELNDIFSAFDRIVEAFGCERLKTIGDAYLAVAGVPEPNADHASGIAKVALRMRRYLERRNAAHPQAWTARIGISSGAVIGSLVGIQKYVYDLFGPGVNLAARMEALSEPMRITTNQATYELLADDFLFTERGEFDIKGFGPLSLYFLDGEVKGHL